MTTKTAQRERTDLSLEIVVIPVSDVDRAKEFYEKIGWRLDADFPGDDFRVIQYTPPGSEASIIFGKNVTAAAPGSAQGLYLIVSDIEAARDELRGRGVEISELFHDGGEVHAGKDEPYLFERPRVDGPDPEHRSYRSFASFRDPDGNGWLLQEVTTRLPGRIDREATTFGSASDLASALRRAEIAHGEHEKRMGGQRDANWPEWYASYIVAEQTGAELQPETDSPPPSSATSRQQRAGHLVQTRRSHGMIRPHSPCGSGPKAKRDAGYIRQKPGRQTPGIGGNHRPDRNTPPVRKSHAHA